ncbi:protein NDR1 [Sesamum alatum]|uniref:Protein NDR1 n=1 Tax=Sesamum alatum TaxID=300844 RepID=A0AAE1Y8I0_9LAMI|nr:protein NDR1 [Sesamum alatum]
MNESEELKTFCKCLLGILTFVICFCMSFQNHKPKCYITDLFVPALNTYPNSSTTTTRANTFIFFDLKLENVMPFNGLRYDNVNLTFSYNYGGYRSTLFLPIARHTVPGFYQGVRKTAHKRDVTTTRGVPWGDAFAAVSNGSTAVFRVDLATNVKSKQYFWYAKKQRLAVRGIVEVGSAGLKENKAAIRLR